MENALSFLSEHKDVAFATVEGDKPKKSFCGITRNGWKYFSKSKGKSYF